MSVHVNGLHIAVQGAFQTPMNENEGQASLPAHQLPDGQMRCLSNLEFASEELDGELSKYNHNHDADDGVEDYDTLGGNCIAVQKGIEEVQHGLSPILRFTPAGKGFEPPPKWFISSGAKRSSLFP
jgi:hypothetical protein